MSTTSPVVRINGCILSYLLFENAISPADQEGFLIGKVVRYERSEISDQSMCNTREETVINVYAIVPSFGPFYDANGNVNHNEVNMLLDGVLAQDTYVVGWYRFRRHSTPQVALRESTVHSQLLAMFPINAHFLFGVFTYETSQNFSTHSIDYVFYYQGANGYSPLILNIVNLGDTSHMEYRTHSHSSVNMQSGSFPEVLRQHGDFTSCWETEDVMMNVNNELRTKFETLQEEYATSEAVNAALELEVSDLTNEIQTVLTLRGHSPSDEDFKNSDISSLSTPDSRSYSKDSSDSSKESPNLSDNPDSPLSTKVERKRPCIIKPEPEPSTSSTQPPLPSRKVFATKISQRASLSYLLCVADQNSKLFDINNPESSQSNVTSSQIQDNKNTTVNPSLLDKIAGDNSNDASSTCNTPSGIEDVSNEANEAPRCSDDALSGTGVTSTGSGDLSIQAAVVSTDAGEALQEVVASSEAVHASNEAAHASNEAAHASNEAAHASNEAAHASNEAAHTSRETFDASSDLGIVSSEADAPSSGTAMISIESSVASSQADGTSSEAAVASKEVCEPSTKICEVSNEACSTSSEIYNNSKKTFDTSCAPNIGTSQINSASSSLSSISTLSSASGKANLTNLSSGPSISTSGITNVTNVPVNHDSNATTSTSTVAVSTTQETVGSSSEATYQLLDILFTNGAAGSVSSSMCSLGSNMSSTVGSSSEAYDASSGTVGSSSEAYNSYGSSEDINESIDSSTETFDVSNGVVGSSSENNSSIANNNAANGTVGSSSGSNDVNN